MLLYSSSSSFNMELYCVRNSFYSKPRADISNLIQASATSPVSFAGNMSASNPDGWPSSLGPSASGPPNGGDQHSQGQQRVLGGFG